MNKFKTHYSFCWMLSFTMLIRYSVEKNVCLLFLFTIFSHVYHVNNGVTATYNKY